MFCVEIDNDLPPLFGEDDDDEAIHRNFGRCVNYVDSKIDSLYLDDCFNLKLSMLLAVCNKLHVRYSSFIWRITTFISMK